MVIAGQGQGQGQSQDRTSSRSAIPDVASLLDVPELKGIVHTSSDRGWKKLIKPWNVNSVSLWFRLNWAAHGHFY
jgi:hypothetical protein